MGNKGGGYRSPTQTRKGVPNKTTAATRERIENEADPIGFLARVVAGLPLPVLDHDGNIKQYDQPSAEQRINAAKMLANKLCPDVKSVEFNAPGVESVVFQLNTPIPPPYSESTVIDQSNHMTLIQQAGDAITEVIDE